MCFQMKCVLNDLFVFFFRDMNVRSDIRDFFFKSHSSVHYLLKNKQN